MRNTLPILCALLLICSLTSPCLATGTESAASPFDFGDGIVASSQNKQKVVSVVYDDSTSMSGDGCINWSYANYAFQSFYAMLNRGDVLYFTTTAAPSRTTRYDAVDKQTHVDDIRSYFDAGNTFIESAQTAMEALLTHEGDSEMIEYWLVIITDGEFYDRNYDRLTGTMLNDLIGSYAQQIMPDGSTANVAYIPIGDMPLRVEEDENNNIFVRSAQDTESIITAISDVAQLMSRSTAIKNVSFADYSVESPTSIKITTELPVRSICVMLNHSSAELTDAKNSDGRIRFTECLSLKYPEYPGCVTDHSLYGSISFLGGGSAMTDGEYLLNFSAEFLPENVEVFIEPAIELRLAVFDKATQRALESLNPIYTKQELYARYEILNSLTGEELPLDDYFKEINLGIQYGTQNSFIAFSADREKRLYDMELREEPMYVSAMAELDDLAILKASLYFTPEVYVDYEVVWCDTEADIARTALMGNTDIGYSFTVLSNGEQLSGGDLKRMGLSVEIAAGLPYVECLIHIDKDGTVTAIPHYLTDDRLPSILLNWLATYTLDPGDIVIGAGFYSEYAHEQIRSDFILHVIKENPARTVINILQPFLFALLVVGYILRPRFEKKA